MPGLDVVDGIKQTEIDEDPTLDDIKDGKKEAESRTQSPNNQNQRRVIPIQGHNDESGNHSDAVELNADLVDGEFERNIGTQANFDESEHYNGSTIMASLAKKEEITKSHNGIIGGIRIKDRVDKLPEAVRIAMRAKIQQLQQQFNI